MQSQWKEVTEVRERSLWERHLLPLATQLVHEAECVAQEAASAMQAGSPELFADPASARAVTRATAQNISQFGQLVVERGDPRDITLTPATTEVATGIVQRDINLAALLRVYSLGHERVWSWIFDRLTQNVTDGGEFSSSASLLSKWLFAYVNESTRKLTTIYEEERRLWLTSALAEQAEAAAAIVSGEEVEEVRASRRLRHDLARVHLGLCAWTEEETPTGDVRALVRQSVREAAALVGVESPLILPEGSTGVKAWLSSRRVDVDAGSRALRDFQPANGVLMTLGNPANGLTGFRRSHLEARHAMRVRRLIPSGRRVTAYDDVAIMAIGSADDEQARHFVQRVLGALAHGDDATSRLADTLKIYLDEAKSRSRAAQHLHVHPNTVSYRVRQAEGLLGRSIDHDTLALRLALALRPVANTDQGPRAG